MRRSVLILGGPIAALALVAAACGSDANGRPSGTSPAATVADPTVAAGRAKGSITVFAAASLTEAFNEAGVAFTAANPGAKVTFSFDASSALVQQIAQGAPADVFASADTVSMDKLTGAGLAAAPVVFATNRLSIIVPPGNPKGVAGLADLARNDLKVVLCAPEVPCGNYARQVLDAARTTVTPASLEQNVKAVVTKVTAGEADAGIVYTSDVAAAGAKATAVPIPAELNVVATYPIAALKASAHADVDAAFIAFLTGHDGRAILAKYGFGAP